MDSFPQYIQAGDPGSFKDLVDNSLLPLGVLIGQEAEALIKYSGNKHKLLYSWSMVALKRIMQAPMVRLLSIVLRITYPQQYPTRIMGPNDDHKY